MKLRVHEEAAQIADAEIGAVVGPHGGDPAAERIRVATESLVRAPERIDRLAAFIVSQ